MKNSALSAVRPLGATEAIEAGIAVTDLRKSLETAIAEYTGQFAEPDDGEDEAVKGARARLTQLRPQKDNQATRVVVLGHGETGAGMEDGGDDGNGGDPPSRSP